MVHGGFRVISLGWCQGEDGLALVYLEQCRFSTGNQGLCVLDREGWRQGSFVVVKEKSRKLCLSSAMS